MQPAPAATIIDEIIDLALDDGAPIRLRAIAREDGAMMREGIAQMSPRSRYLRFFSGAAEPPPAVIASLLDVDGITHLGWGAIDCAGEGQPAIGAVHAVAPGEREPDGAMEFSVAVVDAWQGRGVARLLTAALLVQLMVQQTRWLEAHVLAENPASLEFMRMLGGVVEASDGNVLCVRLEVAHAHGALRQGQPDGAMAALLARMERHLRPPG
jgi:GNAT superfamily N-acetyltransferase